MSAALVFPPAGPRRPVIARDDCLGCNRCVLACAPRALELVWDFATLVRPDDCDGCGLCAPACPHGVIHMSGP